jgi:ABC-type glycerol-3-phosphate transport system substrate-binding protein
MAWLNHFMTPATLAEWAANHYGIPTIDAAFEDEAFAGEFYQATAENLASNGIFIEPSLCYVEALTKLSETLQDLMLSPDMDIADALEDSQDQIRQSCGQK